MNTDPMVPWWPMALRLWAEGYSQTQIAEAVGVSRQRIEQLADWFPGRPWIRPRDLGDLAGIAVIRKWAREGAIRRSPGGRVLREDVEDHIVELVTRPCEWPGCEDPVDDIRSNRRFCAAHTPAVESYRYPVMSQEERARAYQANQRWREKNPERRAEIQRRANHAYRERQRLLGETAS